MNALAAAVAVMTLAATAASWATTAEARGEPDTALPPALRPQVFQRSPSTFDVQVQGQAPAPMGAAARLRVADDAPPAVVSWHQLARGTLLRAQLNEDAALTLRLRGGRVGLYLAVRFPAQR